MRLVTRTTCVALAMLFYLALSAPKVDLSGLGSKASANR